MRTSRERPTNRRGTTLMELTASLSVLAAIVTLAGGALQLNSAQRADAERRQLALQEAANCLERLKFVPLAELTPEKLAQYKLSPEAARSLRGGELAVQLAADAQLAPAQRLTAEVRWKSKAGAIDNSVRLVAVKFP